ncbi:2Fe-2S iron-sulfur cluster-binding protein [Telmatobacter sp. DSM 110680]|uniref:2Fe-2S iron-sulfur cluster-binding protein n=1 Tax=Telmatobacter sp. DSM 110680 TaxID=3036704 RepID=A0AAU7DT25_9BACT
MAKPCALARQAWPTPPEKKILTIEGLGQGETHFVREAWIAEQVPQGGYCQPGQFMTS